MTIKTWNIKALTGYEPQTTFYEDFSIADRFGINAVKDTQKRAFDTAKFMGYIFLTELAMVLNWKIWEHYERNEKLALVYNDLWQETALWIEENLEGEELSYYFDTVD